MGRNHKQGIICSDSSLGHLRYVKGEKLRDAVKALGSLDVIWAEMGNTPLGVLRKFLSRLLNMTIYGIR